MREKKLIKYFRRINPVTEVCFNIEIKAELSPLEEKILKWLLGETFVPEDLSKVSFLNEKQVNEIGPLLNFSTSWNTNALSIFESCGVDKVSRIEMSYRKEGYEQIYDRMTQTVYKQPLKSFILNKTPEPVYEVPLIEKGLAAFNEIKGLSMDDFDKKLYYNYFVKQNKRNPTIVEIMDLNNANSEHCRHGYFKGRQVINGEMMPLTLMDMVKSTWKENPQGSIIAFFDNSSGIDGYLINTLMPISPMVNNGMEVKSVKYNFIFTAETHNFPTGVAPFPGAQTGTGGRIRDVLCTGRGAKMLAGTVGYCVGNLFLNGYDLPWEKYSVYPGNLAPAKEILIKGSDGTTRYGNEIGEPVIQGFLRAGASYLPDGTRYEFLKPILFSGGLGQIDSCHIDKQKPKPGMVIVQIGGPAYRIGFGGGAASSKMQGENKAQVDYDAVQRGDAEMEQKVTRVVSACVEMGEDNPIASIHDQGAGGPANVLKELVEEAGGSIDIRKINLGDKTLSVLEIWVAEYQERIGLLVYPDDLKVLTDLCEREKVPIEILGEVTGDGFFTVNDQDGTKPVHLNLKPLLNNMPQKTFESNSIDLNLQPLKLSAFKDNSDLKEALIRVLRLPAVGSKGFLTRKGDRSVSGLIVQQQCCGYPQLPVSDVAITAQSHFPNDKGIYSGAAISMGEQPIKMLVDVKAGARMAVAEAITNMAPAVIRGLDWVKCSANWMGAPKLPGEGVRLYQAAESMAQFMKEIGMAVDGGKDSLSMATKVQHEDGKEEIVKSPLQLVISAYCQMDDISKAVSPDIKNPGNSLLMKIDLSPGKKRLGASALAQVYGELGNECPDIESQSLVNGFNCIQELVRKGLISACHDISDGGMITTVLEMAFAGNCGLYLFLDYERPSVMSELFAEEAGWVIEYNINNQRKIKAIINKHAVSSSNLGSTTDEDLISVYCNDSSSIPLAIIKDKMSNLRQEWERTSYELEKLQCKPSEALSEFRNTKLRKPAPYKLTFKPKQSEQRLSNDDDPKVAILRTEGSNGDREMAAFFKLAGCNVCDVHMSDLENGSITLSDFQGLAFVGGFANADALDSAKGWAASILFNPKLKKMFDDFYHRKDTFSLGVCNGCQLSSLLGWVPTEGLSDENKIRFVQNHSERFESRFLSVKIQHSPAIMLKGMTGSVLGVWCAHGEGRFHANDDITNFIHQRKLAPMRYVDDDSKTTETYPFNPNGSSDGIAAVCSEDGRHLAMMPHPERAFLKWQWAYMPEDWKQNLEASPWLKMTQNAYNWCKSQKK